MSQPLSWPEEQPPLILWTIHEAANADKVWDNILSDEVFHWQELMKSRDRNGRIYTIAFLRGANDTPDGATQPINHPASVQNSTRMKRMYPECRSPSGRILVCYSEPDGQRRTAISSRDIDDDVLENIMKRTPGVERWEPTGFIAGAIYASIWPMSLGEIGGGVDLMLRYKLMGDVGFAQEP
jgi:hypothetical protein